jgi:xanthine dehydrogenase large subunit
VSLSAQAHYATPHLHFDKATGKGIPFAYHAVGTAIAEVTLDLLRGTLQVDSVRLVHDAGQSLNRLVDRGQIEGGLLQGIGWVTMEECLHDAQGCLLTDTLTTYKIPDLYSAPGETEIEFMDNPTAAAGIMGSKAIGEPPLMYGIGVYLAALDALGECGADPSPLFRAPLTAERILQLLEQRHCFTYPLGSHRQGNQAFAKQ